MNNPPPTDVVLEMQARERARLAQGAEREASKKAARDAILKDIPAEGLSIPALRAAINEIKALLRGDV